MTDSRQKRRAKIGSEGSRHLQVIADAETLKTLEELKKRLHMRRQTRKIVKMALKMLLDNVSKNTITA